MVAKVFGIPFRRFNVKVVADKTLNVGGTPIGLSLRTKGVLVIGKNTDAASDATENKHILKFDRSQVQKGDIITEINGQAINSAIEIAEIINRKEYEGQPFVLSVTRGKTELKLNMTPTLDSTINKYVLGLWIKDNLSGIGTVTYVDDSGWFASLGHAISDSDTGIAVPIVGGEVHPCKIIGINKATKGQPGELRGVFLKNESAIGNAEKNTGFGVYGKFQADCEHFQTALNSPLPVGSQNTVKAGKAKIRCTVGETLEEYDIEIIKTKRQRTPSDKGMIIRITDKKLLARTGGIVQGMSGSPIIQNNRIVGAVTHVFLNDSTKGYGLYLDWMLEN
jgi:stage IV sporulation protein B